MSKGVTAKQIFDRAQLPNDILVRIWNLADTEMRGMLSATEFIIAMHLLACYRNGSLRALPQNLPAGLYEAAARRGAPPPRQGPSPRSSIVPPSSISRQFSGAAGAARTSSPLAQQPYVGPQGSSQGSAAAVAAVPGDWAVTPQEKAKYDSQFAKLDTSKRGFVSGEEAVGFFSNSGLPEDDLAQVWDLSDINSEGKLSGDEFAVAMHLILQKVQTRGPLPTTLPANLIPPSMRRQTPAPARSTAPAFEARPPPAPQAAKSAAEDLFGLDAFAGPPQASAAAQPQVAQSSGGSSSFMPSSPRAVATSPSPQQPQKTDPSTFFKPFVPSSSFGQSIMTPSTTGSTPPQQSRAIPSANDDLLGESDAESRNLTQDQTELGNMSNQMNILQTQTKDLYAKRSTTEQTQAQQSSTKRDIEQRLAQMRSTYEQEARDVKALEDRLNASRAETGKLQQDLSMVMHTQQSLSEEHQKVAQALQDDQQEHASINEHIAQVNNEVNQLKGQLEKMRSDARQQKGRVAINRKQLATVEQERDRLMIDLEAASKDHADATREIEETQRSIDAVAQERELHNSNLSVTRERAVSATKDREAAKAAHEAAQKERDSAKAELEAAEKEHADAMQRLSEPAPMAAPVEQVASPVPSTSSTNPFFKRSMTAGTDRGLSPEPPRAPVISPINHSAFDDFFGPSMAGSNTPAPAPLTSFNASLPLAQPTQTQPELMQERSAPTPPPSRPQPRTTDSMAAIPPSPPRSRQISSSVLPLRTENVRALSEGSSVDVLPPESRAGGTPPFSSPVEKQSGTPASAAPGSSKLKEAAFVDAPENAAERSFESSRSPEDDFFSTHPTPSRDIPGSFPDAETPAFQTPNHSGSATGRGLEPSGLAASDPFASASRTPEVSRDDFDPAFNGFSGKGKEPQRPGQAFPMASAPLPATDNPRGGFSEIQHFDDDDSDSESDKGFDDDFEHVSAPKRQAAVGTQRPVMERGPSTTQELPPITAQTSPPTYSDSVSSPVGADGRHESNQFPREYKGLLPSREDPIAPQAAYTESAVGPPLTKTGSGLATGFFGDANARDHAAVNRQLAPSQMPMAPGSSNDAPFAYSNDVPAASSSLPTQQSSAPKASAFDNFDDDFNDLSEAHEEENGVEDLNASVVSRRETLDHEFNPTFDSPAPSTKATSSYIFPDSQSSRTNDAFADFGSTMHGGTASGSSGIGFASSNQTGPSANTITAPVANHDWDAMFAGLGSSNGQVNGAPNSNEGLINDNVGEIPSRSLPTGVTTIPGPATANPAAGSSQTQSLAKPQLGRALTAGTEHDDPILKRLTGMGYSRDQSLRALEKYDYNIDRVRTSRRRLDVR